MADNLATLLELVRESPDDDAAWAVLGDAILEAGDPRGPLLSATGDDLAALLANGSAEWFGMQGTAEGNVLTFLEDTTKKWGNPKVELTFERGHVCKLLADTSWDGGRDGWGQEWMYPLLTRVLTQPMGKVVTEIEVRATPYSEFFYEGLVEAITAAGPLAVRKMYCGDDDQLSWTNVPKVSTLWEAAPYLRELTLEGSNIELGDIAHPRLAVLKLISGGLPEEPVSALASADLPALRELDVWFGSSDYGAACSVETVQPLLAHPFPSLRSLGLVNCEFSDDLVAVLPDAVWLPQLEELRLGQGILTDAGAASLIAAAEAYQHLEKLDISECFLVEPEIENQLRSAFGDALLMDDQNDPYEDGDDEPWLYVSLGE